MRRIRFFTSLAIAACLFGMTQSASAVLVWGEDFEFAFPGATHVGANDIIAGTSVYAKNITDNNATVVAAPAGFTGNTGQVLQINATTNGFEGLTAGANGATVPLPGTFADTETYTFNMDLYIPNNIAGGVNIGQIQHRWKFSGAGDNVLDPNNAILTNAGVYNVSYTGTLDSVSNQSMVNEFAHFIRFWENNASSGLNIGDPMVYVDNIQMFVGDTSLPTTREPIQNIEFDAPDFSDGSLAIQQGWNAGAGWNVADAAGVGNANTSTESQSATHLGAIFLDPGEQFKATLDFEFQGTTTPLASGVEYLMATGLKATNDNAAVSNGSSAADVNLQLYSTDNYRLLNNFAGTGAAITNGMLDGGDQLELGYTLTLGADAASTKVDVTLKNLTDLEAASGSYTGIDQTVYDALTTGDGAHYFFQSSQFDTAATGITGIQVNSLDASLTAPPVLPTPGTPEAPSPLTGTNLFTDTFDRADSTGPTAAADDSTTGMSSAVFTPAVGTTYAEFEGSFAPGDGPGGIENNKLSLGLGNGEAMAGIDRNFTDAEILTAGGFAIEAIVDPNNDTVANGTSGADDNRYFAIGVGLTQAAATTETMVDGGTGEGSNADRQVLEQAAFAFTLEDDGQYNAFDSWAKDQQPNFPGQEVNLTNTTTVTPLPTDVRHDEASVIDDGDAMTFGQNDFLAQTGLAIEQDEYKLRLEFRFTDFNAGTDVEVTAFIEDVQIDLDPSNGIEANPGDRDTYTFQWDGTNQNYVMFQGRPGSAGESTADFLMIETLAAVGVPGDFDGDGFVGLSDLNILGANFGAVGTGTLATGDANGDGDVDLADLNILGANWNPPPAVSVPEPTTLALAAFAAAGFLARRRS